MALAPRTHFEQISVEVVQKIASEAINNEEHTNQMQEEEEQAQKGSSEEKR